MGSKIRPIAVLLAAVGILGTVVPVAAEDPGDTSKSLERVQAQSPAAAWRDQTLPLLEAILHQRAALGLSPTQVETFERLAVDFAREVIRRQADRQIALLDLITAFEPDPRDPAKPIDVSLVEPKIREIERIGGDLELARLRAIEAGKAQLSAEQRAKLGGLLAGDDPSDPPDVTPVAAHPGGGPPSGSPGGGPPGHPPGTGPPGHPPAGPPGPGYPPGWHGAPGWHPPGGYHPGFRGGVYVGVWPWYWWGYPGPLVMPAPAPPSYWYFCPAYGAYYPSVPSCPEPWVFVPAG
ncbi:MAG TPA: hypothetical protein VEL75_11075 [Candidatus Methylomirabilis sp.]|nr:hypothetical protein [Candidatus Methylomirabilis sp.]